MKDSVINLRLSEILDKYSDNIKLELREIWNEFEIDLSKKEQYEVIGGIIARQVSIAIQFVANSGIWTNDTAPIILRSLADNYINLAWILESPLERSRLFIQHGLGQEKAIIEHRKKQIIEEEKNPEEDELIKFGEMWINSQKYTFLTDVDFGSWSGRNTRQMAKEANCEDFYNHVYLPFSTAAHSMWNHVAKYNLTVSDNILHKHLMVPTIPKGESHLDYLDLAAKYVDKCFFTFYQKFSNLKRMTSSYKELQQDLNELVLNIKKQ